MSLKDKIKGRFNKKEETPIKKEEIDSSEIIPAEPKYKNMTIYAPPRTVYKDSERNYYPFRALDENNKPIVNETIPVKISEEKLEIITDEDGVGKIPSDFPAMKHPVTITFPNGKYSPSVRTKVTIRETGAAKKKKKKRKILPRYTSINAPHLRMYVYNESQYYVKLRNQEGRPIEGEEIIFTLKDEEYTSITDEYGFARLDIKNLKSGRYKITSEFKGSDKYDPCESESEVTLLIRDIDKEVIIDVQNLTMEFKVTKDKIDTLKEFAIRSLKRNKETHEKIRVLDDITFQVYKGDKLGILGFNGAGKSTLLKIMAGIYEPTSGSIKAYGNIAPLLELGAGFDKNYTGKNNIFLNGALLSINEKIIKEKYDDIVEFSELGEFINYPIKNYSSGMRTKLGFSIATLINPDILIIDEILSVGDIKFRKKSADKINSMMQDGATVLLVSHSIKTMKNICNRCIWLEDGKIKMEGDAEEVCDAYVKGAKIDIKKNKKK